jgi:hypothetical protein
MTEYWPDRTATGTPKYYADWDRDTHYVAPTPSANTEVELAYLRMPDNLSASNTSTWISQNAPNVLLYGCILEGLAYLKGPTDMIQYYQGQYENALTTYGTEQIGYRRRDEYEDGMIRQQLKSKPPELLQWESCFPKA